MITCLPFGYLESGEKVNSYVMQNGGISVTVIEYGAAIQSFLVPAKSGDAVDIVIGYDDIESYERGTTCQGAVVGRYANRIKNAAFTIGGREYKLTPNDGPHHLHGVFEKRLFKGEIQGDTLVLKRYCPSVEEGYPGNLTLEVRYTLGDDGSFTIKYIATTDADTVLNITNHSFINLNGHACGSVLDHTLYLNSDSYTEADENGYPTGNILPVDGTPLDFRTQKPIGRDIFSDFPAVKQAKGYDHNMIIKGEPGTLRKAAELTGDVSGIKMTILTTQPAAQLYTANYVEQDAVPFGKDGVMHRAYGSVCIETQHYPASPNFPQFPSTLLYSGDVFAQTTVWKFS